MVSRQHRLWWQSSYDRGLDHLLFMWPDIRKAVPDAELWITYGWNLFDKVASNNPERMKWKSSVEMLMDQPGIKHFGRIGQDKMSELRKQCGIWAYPTDFQEISCIGAMETQRDGLVPVTMAYAALKETVKSGILIEGDIHVPEVAERFLQAITGLMTDKKKWESESKKAQKKVRSYYWPNIALKWNDILKRPISTPEVSVITITIREGWWGIMADNLAKQTYKIKEWVIVDDHPNDRSQVAKKIADKYKLNIKYLRGNKTHRYGLVAANNIGWQNATGELLVYLQDFVLIPDNGIESLVDIYRHHPNALISPVDIYYHCKQPDLEDKIDWWHGETDIIGKEAWRNIRVLNQGIRQTDNPYDFEMNYGAVPRKVLKELNGWWEFFDNGFGFDNTELAYRHLAKGGEIIVDDTNICKCINLWPWIGGKKENVIERQRHQAVPQYQWFVRQMENQKLPMVRDEKLDKTIKIDYSVPDEIDDKHAPAWVEKNAGKIVKSWKDL